ncbi:hypothetical protein HETIRDRAFT_430720 [Heterobasidion irregulare TC 32-1]|uniref:Uncharacterized protein n=1 Tax=Heterobasidion irregulare (strain TC 32-1) TaxID=747525 RepID=W4JPA6_HETIT|nr:uncharacterized protein HETIRDRAFT_430720 [Heterobasidion irregulare TC 32-1]ETW75294.1 hypothetical protein HETIRDRAFT_430720 [Heterobasidion irregulare TC 32-1]
MFSLVKLTTFVALAFGAIASVSAAPQPAAAVQVKRQSDAITAILADLTAELAPAAAQLNSLNAHTATAENITPIVNSIVSSVQNSQSKISALPAQDTSAISANDIASGLNSVFQTVLVPAGNVIALPGVDSATVVPALSPLGGALDGLLTIVLGLVAELLVVVKATLDTLLSGLVHVLVGLNLTGLLASLGL